MSKESIKQLVQKLMKKHATNNPFEIASNKNIIVRKVHLGDNIRGFYMYRQRNKVIHINSNLDYEEQRIVCAHELGHALLHPKSNFTFLMSKTYFNMNKFEVQANLFCTYLLVPDLSEYENMTMEQISQITNVPVSYLKKY